MRRFLLCLLVSFAAHAQLPPTPVGTQLAEWLRVFSTGDQEAYSRFIAERYTKPLLDETAADYRAGLAGRTFLDTHGFEVRSVEQSTPLAITVPRSGIADRPLVPRVDVRRD
jgi:hypothetical protein